MKMKKILIGMITVAVSLSALADYTKISGVMVQQRWPWSRLVDIDYMLVCAPGDSVDVVVEAYNGSERLDLPAASFSGDLYGVQSGARRIVWDPAGTPYGNDGVVPEFRVVLTPTPPPLYMIIDLTQSAGATGQIEYVYEADLTNGSRGAWVRDPVTNRGTVVESVIWTGVTTNDLYKTDKLVLRRIPKGTFEMGRATPPEISVTLTKDFYTGVFQVTQRQWELIMGEGEKPSLFKNPDYYATRPVESISYDNVRGATNSVPVIDWPETGSLVEPSSFVGMIRAKTGLTNFDLPTRAQWEYACRAGTTTYFNDGDASASVAGEDYYTNAWMNVLGRYKFNGGYVDNGGTLVIPVYATCGSEEGTATVGSYLPNAWGLYDMHGNLYEFCLNWYGTMEGGEDPKGGASGEYRLIQGGTWDSSGQNCSLASHSRAWPYTRHNMYGVRLVMTLP